MKMSKVCIFAGTPFKPRKNQKYPALFVEEEVIMFFNAQERNAEYKKMCAKGVEVYSGLACHRGLFVEAVMYVASGNKNIKFPIF
jgi:hypothetical protein